MAGVTSSLESWAPGLIGLFFWGLPAAYLGWQWWLERRSRRWPSTVGRVISSRVIYDAYRLPRRYAVPGVEYEYTVDGTVWRGRRVRFGGWLNTNPEDAGVVAMRYKEGSPVSVRYDPRNPRRSTLERRMSRLVQFLLVICLLQMAAIAGALVGWWE